MAELSQKDSIFFIEKQPYLNRKRNNSINSELSLKNFQIPEEQSFQIESAKNISFNTGETTNILRPILKKGKWSEEEDNLLIKYINKFGVGKWNKIERYLIGRSRKQIRQRYISNIKIKKISEEIKSNISYNSESSSDEESNQNKETLKIIQKEKEYSKNEFKWNESLDQILLKEYLLNKKSWVKISKKIPGSSENSVKNRFYSLLRQKANRVKKAYKYRNRVQFENNEKNNNNLILLVKKEISGNIDNSNKCYEGKEILFKNLESDHLNNKSLKKNYSVEILLEFLPELIEEKRINIERVKTMVNDKKIAITKIVSVLSNHLYIKFMNELNIENKNNNNEVKICNVKEGNSKSSILFNMQIAQLGFVIEALNLKMMETYFKRLKSKTLGI